MTWLRNIQHLQGVILDHDLWNCHVHCGHMGPHGDLIQFLGPYFCSKVPIVSIEGSRTREKFMQCHYLMLIIRLLVITQLALMNPTPVCQWSQFCSRTMFSPLLKALFQWISLFWFQPWIPWSPDGAAITYPHPCPCRNLQVVKILDIK